MPSHRLLRILPALLLALLSCTGSREPAWWDQEKRDDALDREIGQMIMVGFRGLELSPDSPLSRDLERGLGGVILFDRDVALNRTERNIAGADQVRRLTRQLQARSRTILFIAVDQEGGKVSRFKPDLGFPAVPPAAVMGQGSPQETARWGRTVGRTLNSLGVNLNFAPVLDVNVNPDSPVIGGLGRSFGSDPDRVAAHGRAFVHGLQQEGVLACVKHFPGHGSSRSDSHLGLTDVSATWTRQELAPFAALLGEGGVRMVMTGHLFNRRLDPGNPASLSHKVVTTLLRQTLGFEGVVITDDLQMGAITRHYGLEKAVEQAVLAGTDILLFGNNIEYDPRIADKVRVMLGKLVREGRVPRSRIKESYERIMRLKRRMTASD